MIWFTRKRAEIDAFNSDLDRIVAQPSGSPALLPTGPADLTTFAASLNTAEQATWIRPAYADNLLESLLRQQARAPKLQLVPAESESLEFLPPPQNIELPHVASWLRIAAVLVLATAAIGILWQFVRQDDDKPVIAPSEIPGTPIASPSPSNASLRWSAIDDSRQLRQPTGLTVAPDGTIWVIDTIRSLIRIYNPDGTQVETWGEVGSEPGQFNFVRNPVRQDDDNWADVAFDSQGNIYVVDAGNHRVQKFSPDRKFLQTIGSFGGGPDQFLWPFGITIDANDVLYIADDHAGTVHRFSTDGASLGRIGSSGPNPAQLNGLGYPAIAPDGSVWIPNWGSDMVSVFSPDGDFVFSFGTSGSDPGQFLGLSAIAFDTDGNAFVSDLGNHRIQVFDDTGRYLWQWSGLPDGTQFEVHDLAFGPGGTLYAIDKPGGRLLAFDVSISASSDLGIPVGFNTDPSRTLPPFSSAGAFQTSFRWQTATQPVDMTLATGMDVAPDGSLWVAEAGSNTIRIFSAGGAYLESWGESGAGPGQFAFIADAFYSDSYENRGDILFLSDGSFLVSDPGNQRVQRFDADRTWLGDFARPDDPEALAEIGNLFDLGNGEIGVTDLSTVRIGTFDLVVYSADGVFQRRQTMQGSLPLAFAADGSYWARIGSVGVGIGPAAGNIVKFDASGNQIGTLSDPTGSGADVFGYVGTAAIDADGNLYLANYENATVSIFDSSGVWQLTSDGNDAPTGMLNRPTMTTLGPDGTLFVLDYEAQSISAFTVTQANP